jgi:hypothetical protein
VWKTFYKNMLDGTFNPGSYKKRQVGSGIAGMYAKNLRSFCPALKAPGGQES